MKKLLLLFLCLFFTNIFFAQTDIQIILTDSYGDGWNGATYNIDLNGSDGTNCTIASVASGTLASGSTVTDAYTLADGCYTFTIDNQGSYPGEVSWEIFDATNSVSITTGTATVNTPFDFTLGGATCFIPGCTDPTALNFDPAATCDDGSCIPACSDNPLTIILTDSYGDGWNGAEMTIVEKNGCADGASYGPFTITGGSTGTESICVPDACYSVIVTDGSYPGEVSWEILNNNVSVITGTTGAESFSLGSAQCPIFGCTDPLAPNYDPSANCDDGSCLPPPPVEDNCMGAITIPVTVDMCTGQTTGNNLGSTDSDNDVPAPPAATCSSYGGGDIWFKLAVPASGNVTISGAASDCCSFLWYELYTGTDCSALTTLQCSATGGNDPSTFETALTGQTPGATIWIRAWDSLNDDGPGDFSFCAYELSCTAPTVTIPADPIDNTNCPATVDVSISIDDLGDSGTLTITAEDDMGNPTGTGGMVSATGVFIVTGVSVPQTSWSIIIAHESNPTCNVVLGPFLLNCPPVNDAACDAEAITVDAPQISGTNAYSTFETSEVSGSCWASTTGSNSVWYSFVAPGSGLVEITTDFATGLTDSQIALYTVTDCADLTTASEIDCDEDGGLTGSGWMSYIETSGAPLTGGDTYYVQVDGYGTSVGGFEIQVNELAPANDDCATAAVLAMNTTGSLINQYFAGAEASGMGAEACDVSATPTPADIWYSIDTDADGGNLIIVVEPGPNSDMVVAIYNGCGSAIPEQCVDLGGNGGVETINFTALFQDEKGNSSTTRDANYFVRVYEKVTSGEPFEIGAQGAALPIVLGSFDAKAEKRGNMIEWTTLSEINSDFVEVQSSPNGSTKWETVDEVQTKGESLSRLDYEVFDNNPYAVTYYRLNAVDKDGKSEMSHSVKVRRDDEMGKMSLSPNPTSSNMSLQTVSNADMSGTILIHDMTGKIVQNENVILKNGLNTFSINLDNLNSGIYLFSLRTEDGVQVEKIIKQ